MFDTNEIKLTMQQIISSGNNLLDIVNNVLNISNIESGKTSINNNVYKINSRKDIEEIQRICRIFTIAEKQGNKHKMLSIKNLATFRLVLSNN